MTPRADIGAGAQVVDSATSHCHNPAVDDPEALSLTELANRADVTARTVRYYIAQGLLPAPLASGRGARYGAAHLDRLRLIKRLQHSHLPLADIRGRLSGLDDDQVAVLLAEPEAPPPPAQGERALAYIRDLLGKSSGVREAEAPRAYASQPVAAQRVPPPPAPMQAAIPLPKPSPPAPERSTWERIGLTPDIELHVRRPLNRQSNKDLEQLLALARELFKRR
jgi:DNA-binding transcriptional MerR regulator